MNLFQKLQKGDAFYYHDKPERMLVKLDRKHAVTPDGIKLTDPNVLVFEREGETEATKCKRLRTKSKT